MKVTARPGPFIRKRLEYIGKIFDRGGGGFRDELLEEGVLCNHHPVSFRILKNHFRVATGGVGLTRVESRLPMAPFLIFIVTGDGLLGLLPNQERCRRSRQWQKRTRSDALQLSKLS